MAIQHDAFQQDAFQTGLPTSVENKSITADAGAYTITGATATVRHAFKTRAGGGSTMPVWTYLGSNFNSPNGGGTTDTYTINVGTITDNCFLAVGYFMSEDVTEIYTSITLDGVATSNAVTHTEGFVHMGIATWELTAADSGTSKTLVFTWPNTISDGSIAYGLAGGGLSKSPTGTDRWPFGQVNSITFFNGLSGNGTGTQTIPPDGLGLAVVAHSVPGNAISWTGATEDADFAVTAGSWRKGLAHLTSDADPTASSTGTFVGVMAAFSPVGGISSYDIIGSSATLRKGKSIAAGVGAYNITGTDATLTKAGGNKVVTADPGSYAVTGTAAGLKAAKIVSGGVGAYAVTGTAATPKRGFKTAGGVGAYDITGTPATLRHTWIVQAGAGSYAITGSAATLVQAKKVSGGAGAYSINGVDAALIKSGTNKVISGEAGAYNVNGTAAGLIAAKIVAAGTGLYLIVGTDAELAKTTVAPTQRNDDAGWPARRPYKRRYDIVIPEPVREAIEAAGQSKATPKRKKALARQIVIAAGKNDLLPVLQAHPEETQELGAAILAAARLADAEAHYQAIMALIAEFEAMKEEDEDDEYLMLAS